jgi:hypothetical protein
VFNGVVKTILDMKKLRETEQLENLVHLGLDLKQYKITAFRFDRF